MWRKMRYSGVSLCLVIFFAMFAIAHPYLADFQTFLYTDSITYGIILTNSQAQPHFKPMPSLSLN